MNCVYVWTDNIEHKNRLSHVPNVTAWPFRGCNRIMVQLTLAHIVLFVLHNIPCHKCAPSELTNEFSVHNTEPPLSSGS